MRLITKNTDYAVRVLCHLAQEPDRTFTVDELSERLGIPRPFLRNVLQRLARQGLLASQKGRGGGFRLERPADQIRVRDLVKLFQGPLKLTHCFVRSRACPDRGGCALREKILKVESYAAQEILAASIASLLVAPEPR